MLWEVTKQFSCYSLQIIYMNLSKNYIEGSSQILIAYHQRIPSELPTRRPFEGGQFWFFIHPGISTSLLLVPKKMNKRKTGKTPKIKINKPKIGLDIMIVARCALLTFVLDVDETSL